MQNQAPETDWHDHFWHRGQCSDAAATAKRTAGTSGMRNSLGSALRGGAARVLSVVLIALLGFNLYFPLAKRLTGNPYPSLFGLRQAVVLSNSMAPALMAGDLIVIREAPAYRTGDILTYVDSHVLVTHRLLAADMERLTLQGDANRSPDRPVHPGQVLGKTILRLPAAGTLSRWLRTLR